MPNFTLNNVTVWQTDDTLYISSANEDLIKITGADTRVVHLMIEAFENEQDSNVVFEKLKQELLEDTSYFHLLINYLVENRILRPAFKPAITRPKKLLVIGAFPHKGRTAQLVKTRLDSITIQYIVSHVLEPAEVTSVLLSQVQADIILLFSPFLSGYACLNMLSLWAEDNKVPVLHLGVTNNRFILGPLLDSNLGSPTLDCYIKRKTASLTNPEKYLSVSRINGKARIRQLDVSAETHFTVALEIARIELEKFFIDLKYSLVAREIEFDLNIYESNVTRILTVREPFGFEAPFNI